MTLLHLDKTMCRKEGVCIDICPFGFIERGDDGYPVESPGAGAACVGCGHCVAACTSGALSNSRLNMADFLPALRPSPSTAREVDLLMRGRRSVREFKEQPVDKEVLQNLMRTVRFAPTASNSRHVRWIISLDPAKTRELAAIAREWLQDSEASPRMTELLRHGRDVILRGAPHVAIAHAPSDYVWGATDCAIATTYLDLAATAHGLGTCWAGLLMRAAREHAPLAKALGLPEGHTVHGALMIGIPRFRYYLVPPRPSEIAWL